MALFARKSVGGNWDKISNETPEDLSFPADVLADTLDGANEVSVWEINDPPGDELDILAAALHSQERRHQRQRVWPKYSPTFVNPRCPGRSAELEELVRRQ
jgi:hypothetical protein